jgi:hypothetical protein
MLARLITSRYRVLIATGRAGLRVDWMEVADTVDGREDVGRVVEERW